MKPSTKVLKANTGFRVVTHFGVTHHMNAENSVAYFKSWKDLSKGTAGGMSDPPTYQGIPMTQEELNTHYPSLKENTFLTKAKIGSGKVWFKNLQTPMACMYQGKVYLVAPHDPDDAPVLPKSMTEHKIAAPKPATKPPTKSSFFGAGGGGGIPPIPGVGVEVAPKPERSQPAPAPLPDVPMGLGGGGIPPIPGLGAAAAPKVTPKVTPKPAAVHPALAPAAAPKRKTAAKPAPKPTKRKAKKTVAKPVKNGKPKKTAPAGIVLTAAQKKRLAEDGSVTVKRGGKFVTVTR